MYHQVANQRQILHGIIQRLKLSLDGKERKYAKPMRQMPFTLHQNAGDADKQGISEGEGSQKAFHLPFTTLHIPAEAYIDNDSDHKL